MYRICSEKSDLPLFFRVAQAWSTIFASRRGEYFIYRLFVMLGLHKQLGRFAFFDGKICIPLDIPDTLRVQDFSLYHGLREVNFANTVNEKLGDFVLIDGGAAFGQVSMRLAKLCPRLKQIVAIDPNPDHVEMLEINLATAGVAFQVHNKAISDFQGNAELIFPHGKDNTHSAYIRESATGNIQVTRIDDIVDAGNRDVALKLDIEGQELRAIAGAIKTITAARNICLFVELHPDVLKRNNQKAEELLQAINKVRPFKWVLAHKPSVTIDPATPFFEQVDRQIPYDVIGISQPF